MDTLDCLVDDCLVDDWLLGADPAIRWQAMRDLTDASAAAIAAERVRVPREGIAAEILACQGSDSAWHRTNAPDWLPTLYTMLPLLCFLVSGGTSPCANSGVVVTQGQFSTLEQKSHCRVSPRVTLTNSFSTSSNQSTEKSDIQTFEDCSATDTGAQETAAQAPNRVPRKVFRANDRFEILFPEKRLTLAEANEIPLRIHGTGLTTLESLQTQYHDDAPDLVYNEAPDLVPGGRQTLQILHHTDGSPYANIVPMRLGKIELTLDGEFPDGGLFLQKRMLDVGPPQRRPDKLQIGRLGPKQGVTRILVPLSRDQTGSRLTIYAKYDSLDMPIKIDPAFATFKITSRDQTAPVQLDEKTGRLTPLHPGQALMETTFGGRSNLTCVVVEELIDPNQSYFGENCGQLLSPGEKLGPVE